MSILSRIVSALRTSDSTRPPEDPSKCVPVTNLPTDVVKTPSGEGPSALPANTPTDNKGDGGAAEYPSSSSQSPQRDEGSRAAQRKEPSYGRGLTHYQRFLQRKAQGEREYVEKRKQQEEQRVIKNRKVASRKRRLNERRIIIIREHREALRSKQLQCMNTWGRLDRAQWTAVKDQFINSVLRVGAKDIPFWTKRIDLIVGRVGMRTPRQSKRELGARFEIQVAVELQQLGWNVQLLGKSGDQGGDLLAHKGASSVIVQCKYYTAKVGNAAVQEAIAGKSFYKAERAVVIAPAGFTRQAQELADSATVLLLAPGQLAILG